MELEPAQVPRPALLRPLPWLWMASGLFLCWETARAISGLAHTGGPGTGGVLLLLPVVAAIFVVGLVWMLVGLVLLFGGGAGRTIAMLSAGAVLLVHLVLLPPLFLGVFGLMAMMAADPVLILVWLPLATSLLTLTCLSSGDTARYFADRLRLQADELVRVRSGAAVPRLAPWLALGWRTGGAALIASPLFIGLWLKLSSGPHEEAPLAWLDSATLVVLGLVSMQVGGALVQPTRATLRRARVVCWLLVLGLPFHLLALPAPAIALLFFVPIVALRAMSQPVMRAFYEAGDAHAALLS